MEEDVGNENSSFTGDRDGTTFDRRTYLKLAGSAVASVVVAASESGVARAASDGYGEGGYGEGPYGGGSDLTVHTRDVSNVGDASATLNGSVNDLGGADSADCSFEWRQVGASSWNVTTGQTLSSTASFSTDISGLSSAKEYEYRATAEASNDDTDTGSIVQFSTHSTNSAPTIDTYTLTEAGKPNPHCEITADWSVSDVDGDLESVAVEAFYESGSLADGVTTDVSGSSAGDTVALDIKHASDETFDVVLTVTDSSGESTTQTETVNE